MKFVVTGLSHKTAPIELREKLAQQTNDLSRVFAELLKLPNVSEVCVISTCNRIEMYVAGTSEAASLSRTLKTYLQSVSGKLPGELDQHLYQHEGTAALHHLFRVSSSLDSMVVGEPQILGQVKEAYAKAQGEKASAGELARIFQKAFAVAKRIRTDTGIAENAVSMSFAAVELGRQIFSSLEGKKVLVLGAGKMSTLAAKHLRAYGVAEIKVANRSLSAAQKLADDIGGTASSLNDLPLLLTQADIVISSTASPKFIVDKPLMARVVRERRYRAILFIDIAVPRDIDPAVGDLDNVYVYDVDDLESVLESNRQSRADEAREAERIVEEEVQGFARWTKSQQVVPMIKALREHAVSIANAEVERTLANVKGADKKTESSVRAMGQSIVNKMLHPVLARLKQAGAEGDPQPYLDALEALFGVVPVLEEEKPPAEDEEDNVVQLHEDRG
jgi:glutamyl-tRNA reductase